jgi:hypothetical protein
MIATVTAPDDCTREVIRAPDSKPRIGVLVELARIFFRVLPAASLKPSVIRTMPSKNSPIPPNRLPIIYKLILHRDYFLGFVFRMLKSEN